MHDPDRHLPDDVGEHEFDIDSASEATAAEEKERLRKKKLHDDCINAFKASADFFAEQRTLDQLWRKFYRAIEIEDQWDDVVRRARQGFTVGENDSDTKGERPCLMMNEIKQPIQQTVNEARQARLSLHVRPAKGKASKQEAETRQGILRGIQFHSNATAARLWALENAAIVGRGFYGIWKEYANDGDNELDLVIRLILHQENVYPDPNATQLDLSDATEGTIVDDLAHAEFTRRFPNAKTPKLTDDVGESWGKYGSVWSNDKTYRIGERYYVEQTTKIRLRDPQTGQWGDFEGDEKTLPKDATFRKVPVRRVKYCLYSASEILEEGEWEGRHIPIVQTVGRVHVVDNKVYYKGLVADGMHPQQLINYGISSLAEQVGIGTRAPWLVDSEQIDDFRSWWENANTENYPFLPYKRYSDAGVDLGVPIRRTDEPPILATLQTFQQARDLLKAATGRFGASLGDISPDRSGKAINALKLQGEMGSSDFIDNLANIAMPHESRILNSMLFPLYGHPGRLARLFKDEDDPIGEEVLLNQPFIPGPDGRPQPAPEEGPGLMQRAGAAVMGGMRRVMGGPPPSPPPAPQEYRLTEEGEFETRFIVGKAMETERRENVELLTGLLEAVPDPNFAKIVVPILAKNLDGPAAQELAEALSPKGPDGEKVPPAVQQMMAELEAKLQEATAAAQEATFKLETKAVESERNERVQMRDLQFKHQLEAQRLRVEMMKIEASTAGKLSAEELKIRLQELKGEQERLEQMLEHQHEKELQATELAAKERQLAQQAEHAAAQQVRGATLTEAQRRASVQDARVDSAVDSSRQATEAERDRQAAERQAQAKAQQPKETR